MVFHGSQYSPTSHVKNLYPTLIVSSNYQFPIFPKFSTTSRVLESTDGLDDFTGPRSIDQYPTGRGHGKSMGFGGTEMDMSDW